MSLAWAKHTCVLAVNRSKCAGKGRHPMCPSESGVPASPSPSALTSVTACGCGRRGGKAGVQEGDCSSLEMWKGGLHAEHLIRESKDYCLHVTSRGRD